MSAGAFETRKYSSNETGEVHPIRIQPETLTLSIGGTTNSEPSGARTSKISARVGGGNRQLGLKARSVTIKFPDTAPSGYKVDSPFSLPWLDPSTFGDIGDGDAVSYLGASGVVVGTSPERVN